MKVQYFLLFYIALFNSCNTIEKDKTTKEKLPNIIHIFTDDLGYGDIGCFGATDIKTPHIDQMAKEGIRFTEFYSASSVCTLSRAALMTGRYPLRMGIAGVFFPSSYFGMPTEEITIAEMLKTKNYATGMVGKWHLGHFEKYLPLNQGFDSYFGIPYSNDMQSVVYMRDNEVEETKVDQRYTTRRYTQESLRFIDQHKDVPFFLYLAHNMPHVPIYASEDFEGTSDRGLYGDVIQELDWSVGKIISKLDSLNLLENTLIVFSSDNGPWLVMEDHGGSGGNLREGKMFAFEGGIRVPTVAMWKGKIPAGTVYEDLATQMDWFPTFAKITGSKLPNDRPIDGEDITDVLMGKVNSKERSFLYFEGNELRCFRKGDWKVKIPFSGFDGAPWKKAVAAHDSLLINLKNDAGEQNNLFEKNKELALNLFDEMQQELEALGTLPPLIFMRSMEDNSHYEYLANKKKALQKK